MDSYLPIVLKWLENTVTDEEVSILKQKMYEIEPKWTGRPVGVICYPNETHQYIIFTEELKEYIVYDTKEMQMNVVQGSYHAIFPDPTQILQSFVKQQYKGSLYVIFGKITGLPFIHWEYKGNDDIGSIMNDCICKSEKDWTYCLEFVKSNNSFHSLLDKELEKDLLKYSFAADDIIDYRYAHWFLGKYDEYEKLGLNSIKQFDQQSLWMSNFGETVTIEPYTDSELLNYEDFVQIMTYAPHIGWYCDHCRKYILTQDAYFAKTNVNLNLCNICVDSKAHSFEEEFETISENSDIVRRIMATDLI